MEIKLNRDYINNPLKKGEYPELDDIKFLFLTLNLSREECAKICNCNPEKVKIVCQQNKLTKTREQRADLRRRTNLQKYGVQNVSQLKDIKEKKKQTTLENYGVENPAQSKIIYNKIKETCINKYGVESTNMLDDKKEKIKQTINKKYGVDNIMQLPDYQIQVKQTMLQKYGQDNALKVESIRNKVNKTCRQKYNNDWVIGSQQFKQKTKETNLKKYGVENVMKLDESVSEQQYQMLLDIRQKIKNKLPQSLEKQYNTKRKNKSFNISTAETFIQTALKKHFIVKSQYKCDLYPFACDFYLPELDLYIEYQGNWTHGGFPFVDNEVCREQLNRWKQRTNGKDYFANAIYTWTDLDVRKREIAKQNNLNWIEFFTLNEFKQWYKNICENLK